MVDIIYKSIQEILVAAAAETDPILKKQLLDLAYTVTAPLSEEDRQLFEYVNFDYIDTNPGIIGNTFSSYVGIYIDQSGEYTGVYP